MFTKKIRHICGLLPHQCFQSWRRCCDTRFGCWKLGSSSSRGGQWAAGKATFTWRWELPSAPSPPPPPPSSSPPHHPSSTPSQAPQMVENSKLTTHRRSSGCWLDFTGWAALTEGARGWWWLQPSPNYWFLAWPDPVSDSWEDGADNRRRPRKDGYR